MADNSDSLNVVLPKGTATFVKLFKAEHPKLAGKVQADKPKQFSLMVVYPDSSALKDLKSTCLRAALAKFGDTDDTKDLIKKGKIRMPWKKSGEEDESYIERYGEPFVEGSCYISATRLEERGMPNIVDMKGKRVIDQDKFYSGCEAHISVYCHAYNTNGNKGVTLYLNNVLKAADGKKLGGAVSAEQEFADLIKGSSSKSSGSEEDEDDSFFGQGLNSCNVRVPVRNLSHRCIETPDQVTGTYRIGCSLMKSGMFDRASGDSRPSTQSNKAL